MCPAYCIYQTLYEQTQRREHDQIDAIGTCPACYPELKTETIQNRVDCINQTSYEQNQRREHDSREQGYEVVIFGGTRIQFDQWLKKEPELQF